MYEYTAFDKLRTIDFGGAVTSYEYDANRSRVRREGPDDVVVSFGKLYEMRFSADGAESARRLVVDGRVVGQIVQAGVPGDVETSVESLHDDHLGSTTLVVGQGGAPSRFGYDAWGRARHGDDWLEWLAPEAAAEVGIGYTGHRARLDGGLIDMDGRMYDPRAARFTSADPLTEHVHDAQTYNRYSYVTNRPLVFVDPTGFGIAGPGASGCLFPDEANPGLPPPEPGDPPRIDGGGMANRAVAREQGNPLGQSGPVSSHTGGVPHVGPAMISYRAVPRPARRRGMLRNFNAGATQLGPRDWKRSDEYRAAGGRGIRFADYVQSSVSPEPLRSPLKDENGEPYDQTRFKLVPMMAQYDAGSKTFSVDIARIEHWETSPSDLVNAINAPRGGQAHEQKHFDLGVAVAVLVNQHIARMGVLTGTSLDYYRERIDLLWAQVSRRLDVATGHGTDARREARWGTGARMLRAVRWAARLSNEQLRVRNDSAWGFE